MSTAPNRTRSIRKPGVGSGADRADGVDALSRTKLVAGTRSRDESSNSTTEGSVRKGNVSPSRLPVKPASSTTQPGRARTSSTTRPLSFNGGTSMRPPPRSVTTRPPLASDNHKPNTGLGRTTPTNDPTSSGPSIGRKSSISGPSIPRHTRNSSTGTISSITRPAGAGHTRNTSTSTTSNTLRPPSQSTILQPPSQSSLQTASSTSNPSNSHVSRPTFTTLQQHYSPAKSLAPKPLTASYLAPPTPSKQPQNIALSAETARLQAELLQLSLLHRAAPLVQKQWRESARGKLEMKFEAAKEQQGLLLEEEKAWTEKVNAVALKEWKDSGVVGWGLSEKVHVLDEVLSGVWNLGDNSGKHARAVRRFERWLSVVQHTLDARKTGESNINGLFIDGMDEAWKEECEVLQRKLTGWYTSLKDLGEVDDASSLAKAVNGSRELVRSMLEGLGSMLRIEKSIVESEKEWIAKMCDDSDEDGEAALGSGPAWRQ